MGVPDNEFQVSALVIAVAAHKGFAAFANSSVNLPLVQRVSGRAGSSFRCGLPSQVQLAWR